MYVTGGVQVPVRGDGHLPAQPADGGGRPARHDGVPGRDQVSAGDRLGTSDTASAIPRSALRTSLTPEEGIRRLRRSVPDIDLALKEAVQVEKVCSAQFPYCKISRIDILK